MTIRELFPFLFTYLHVNVSTQSLVLLAKTNELPLRWDLDASGSIGALGSDSVPVERYGLVKVAVSLPHRI